MIDWGKDFEQHRATALSVMSRIVGPDDAEQLVVQVYERTHGVEARSPKALVGTAARQVAISFLRRKHGNGEGRFEVCSGALSFHTPVQKDLPGSGGEINLTYENAYASASDTHAEAEANIMAEELTRRFPDVALALRWADGEKMEDIAASEGITETALRTRIARVREKVKQTWLP